MQFDQRTTAQAAAGYVPVAVVRALECEKRMAVAGMLVLREQLDRSHHDMVAFGEGRVLITEADARQIAALAERMPIRRLP